MPTDYSMETHSKRHSWLNDPLDIMLLIDAIESAQDRVFLRKNEEFDISDAGYSALDKTEPLYLIQPASKDQFVPMGFYTLKELRLSLDKM